MMTSALTGNFKRRIHEQDRRGVGKRRPYDNGPRYPS